MKYFALIALIALCASCAKEPMPEPIPDPEPNPELMRHITAYCKAPYEVRWHNERTKENIELFKGVGSFDTICERPDWEYLWLVATTNPIAPDSIWLSIGCVRVQSEWAIVIRYPR